MARPKRTWEFEVSDHCSRWGYGTKSYRPGVYTTDDPALAAAAAKVDDVHVRELRGSKEADVPMIYPDIPGETGTLEIKDLRTPASITKTCRDCGKVYVYQHKCLKESK